MNILLDMNISPDWRFVLEDAGHACIHWAEVGSPDADDEDVLQWARERQHVVLTLDLDLAALLTIKRLAGPSVVQMRVQDPLPSGQAKRVLALLVSHAEELREGAIVVLDEARTRARVLPLVPPQDAEE